LQVPARFITFEGGEGAGKSTQARLLAERLAGAGIDALITREPGGSPLGEQIRAMILDAGGAARAVLAEALLFYAARADHLEQLIRPALAQGRWVICDRFSASTRVYQGVAGGLPPSAFDSLDALVVGPTVPDLTFVLDVPAETGLARARERRTNVTADVFETRGLVYHQRLRQGFADLARLNSGRCLLIDANRDRQAVAAEVWLHADRLRRDA
jgi:dTMP kinase